MHYSIHNRSHSTIICLLSSNRWFWYFTTYECYKWDISAYCSRLYINISNILVTIRSNPKDSNASKKYYYKGLNSFTVRQISSKINTTVFSMTIICLMLFFTICIFSSALSIKNSLSGNLKDLAPVDIQFSKLQEPLSKEEQENFSKDIIEDYNTTVKDTLQRLDVYKYLKM